MYERVGEITREYRDHLLDVLPQAEIKGPYGATKPLDLNLLSDLQIEGRWDWAFVVRIPPGGLVHEHIDSEPDRFKPRTHVVFSTNDQCESWNGGECYQLEEFGIYKMTPGFLHESLNKGATDRVHLIIYLEKPC